MKAPVDYARVVGGEKIFDPQESIGMNINRMTSGDYLSPQLEDFSKTLSTRVSGTPISGLIDSLTQTTAFGSGKIAPSDIVDVINQMTGTQKVVSLEEIAQQISKREGITVDQARGTLEFKKTQAAYEAISRQFSPADGVTAESLHTQSIKPSQFSKAQLEQQSRLLGRQRALGMALGVAEEELPGFDPLMAAKGPKTGRLNSDSDIVMIKDALLEEYKSTLAELRDSGAPGVDTSRIEQAISDLERASPEQARRIMSLATGSAMHRKYGSVSVASELAARAETSIESGARGVSRSDILRERAVSDYRYASETREFLKSGEMKGLFEEIKSYDLIKGPLTRQQETLRRSAQNKLGEELSKGLRVIHDIHAGSGANVLDIVDTIEAEMSNLYGTGTAKYMSRLGESGSEDLMISLSSLAARRRSLKTLRYRKESFNPIDSALATLRGSLDEEEMLASGLDDLDVGASSISRDQASRLLSFSRERGKTIDSDLEQYLSMVSVEDPTIGLAGNQELVRDSSVAARQAYGRRALEAESRRIESELAEIMSRAASAVPISPEDSSRILDAVEDAPTSIVDEVFDVARSPYRRLSSMLRDESSDLRRLIDSKSFKGFAVGTAALIVGSFIYQGRKNKDISQDTVSGPPLMPGGNPYEQNYPSLQTAQQDFSFNNPTVSGMQYRINTSGSLQDLNRLRGLFGDVIDGPIDATMYNGLPMAGQDPYPDLASRF